MGKARWVITMHRGWQFDAWGQFVAKAGRALQQMTALPNNRHFGLLTVANARAVICHFTLRNYFWVDQILSTPH
jgi:hypothetical protein